MNQARPALQQERAGLWMAGSALRKAFFGDTAMAAKQGMAALDLSKDGRCAAFALALAGDSVRSRAQADDLEKRFPEDTSIRFSYLPTIRASLALNHPLPNHGDASKALDLLQTAVPNEFGTPHGYLGALYPIYARGLAYLAARQGAEAATEFQKILDHRRIVVSDLIGALANLQIGRAFALSGDKTKAKAA